MEVSNKEVGIYFSLIVTVQVVGVVREKYLFKARPRALISKPK